MPTLAEYLAKLRQSDMAIAEYTAIVLLCVVLTIYLYRRVRWFPALAKNAAALLPAIALVAQPLAGIAGALMITFWQPLTRMIKVPSRTRTVLWIILVIALLVRLPRLFESLWYDEAFTYTVSALDFQHLPGAIANDVHPPLYYMVTWLWVHITDASGWALRIPSLAFGLVSIYLMYRLCSQLISIRVGLIAALLMALMPSAAYYSVEARSYALLTMVMLGALVSMIEERRLMLVLLMALMPMIHNLGFIYMGVLFLALLPDMLELLYYASLEGFDKAWDWSGVFLLPLLTLIDMPVLLLTIQQSRAMSDGYWLQFNLAQPLWLLTFNLQIMSSWTVLMLAIPWTAITFLSVWAFRHTLRDTYTMRIALVVVGVVITVIAVSLIWQPIFLPRAMLPVSLLLIIPLAYAVSNYPIFRPVVALMFVFMAFSFYGDASKIRQDYRSIIAETCAGADSIYATSIQTAFIVRGNSELPVFIWSGAVDNGQTMTLEQMPSFGLEVGQPAPGARACVLLVDTPRIDQRERDYVAQLAISTITHSHHFVHPLRTVDAYLVQM